MSTQILNLHCRPFSEQFSPATSANSIRKFAFPCVKRVPALNCKASPWLQKGSACSFVFEGEDLTVLKSRDPETAYSNGIEPLTRDRVDYYSTPEGIVDLNRKGISLALEKRVALFFQQAILCYGMSDFIFSAKGADSQIGTSPVISLSSQDGFSVSFKREAAHSSTIPTLIAHAKDGSTPDGFVYLKGGSSYAQHNATIGMSEAVNGADELIDGKGKDNKLRDIAVSILNRVANGLNPVQATQDFINKLDMQVINGIEVLKKKESRRKDVRGLVLERYHHKIEKIKKSQDSSNLYDRLIGVVIHQDDSKEALLREVIYKKRYDVIRLHEVIESRIGKRIEDVKMKMETRDRSFWEYMLLKEFSESSERKILEKLFCKTAAIFEQEYGDGSSALKSFRTRVEKLRAKHKDVIANLMRDLRADFREACCAEFSFRAGVFKDLRTKVHHWTQVQFCKNYFSTTGSKISQAWVSRMEQLSRINTKVAYRTPLNQRRRYVSLEDAEHCAQTFNVDSGLFLPCLFTSH